MCGIAGFISNAGFAESELRAHAIGMADALSHRGPDDAGLWADPTAGVYLAHRRLSIQDLSELGHQPMISPSGRFVLTYNGEIYNFNELRSELGHSGFNFRGHSDTEVILALIERDGIESALQKAVGMFAIALWDRKAGDMYLARDRMGEKPLYYGWLGGNLVFASELHALRTLPWWSKSVLELRALHLYLRHGYIPCPYSAFQDIYKLVPGTFLKVSRRLATQPQSFQPFFTEDMAGAFCPQPYWSLSEARLAGRATPIESGDAAVSQTDTLLQQIIKNQLISDVPVGTFLSGGIDSTLVTAIAQSVSRQKVRTFTVGFEEKDFNEAEFASEIASHLGTDHTELYVGESDAKDVIPLLPQIYDEPFADPSQIPTYLISAMARKHVTVALSGDGGDELFAGYNRYLYPQTVIAKSKHIPRPLRRAIAGALRLPGPASLDTLYRLLSRIPGFNAQGHTRVGLKLHKLASSILEANEFSMYETLISYWPDAEVPLRHPVHSQDLVPARFTATSDTNFLASAMAYDQQIYLPDNNLTKVDRASMSVSLETRLPLLDHRLVELAWRMPRQFNVSEGVGKQILRRVLATYVPEKMFERPKMGFSVPVAEWIRGPLREWACDLLSPDALNKHQLLDSNKISASLTRHLNGREDNSLRLWSALMLQAWLLKTRP